MPHRPSNTDALLAAQMHELSVRERLSATVAMPAMLLTAWVHWQAVARLNVAAWLICMFLVQLTRLALARRHLDPGASADTLHRRRLLRVVINVLNGAGWASIWFVLDTGRLDFLFMYRFGVLSAALGVTVNSLNVVLPVYLGFVTPLVTITAAYLFMDAAYLSASQRASIAIGVFVYVALLMATARSANRMSRRAFEQSFEREAALHEARASAERELALRERLQLANERLTVLASHDALTGLFNRRHLVDELERRVRTLARHQSGFAVVSLDVDHFKSVNDSLGHQVGDLVLKGAAREISARLRDIDIFGRWGGEEFLCILPHTSFAEAVACAERLRERLASVPLIESDTDMRVTASFGVAVCRAGEDIDALIARVDHALYGAKKTGRNRTVGIA